MNILKNITCFLLDLDGTIYLDGKLFDGAEEFLTKIRQQNKKYCFLTNNSSRSTEDYIIKLKQAGIQASYEEVLTSGHAAIKYLNTNYAGKKVFLFGTNSLQEEFFHSGINLTRYNPDIVVLAYDTEMTYEKLCTACKYIRKGSLYIATHPDANCPGTEFPLPDAGSFMALIEKSTGRMPDIIIGKPEKTLADIAALRFKTDKSRIAMIGDRLNTDILFAKNNGFTSVLTLTGDTNSDILNKSSIKPDVIINSIKDIINII